MSIKNILGLIKKSGELLSLGAKPKINAYDVLLEEVMLDKLSADNFIRNGGGEKSIDELFELWGLKEIEQKKFKALMSNKLFVKDLIARNGRIIKYVDENLRNNKEIASVAMNSNSLSYVHLGEKQRENESFFWKAIKTSSSSILETVDEARMDYIFEKSPFKDNSRIVFDLISKINVDFLGKTEKLKGDKRFVLKLFKQIKFKSDIYQLISEDLRNDADIIKCALEEGLNVEKISINHPQYVDFVIGEIKKYNHVLETEYIRVKTVDGLFEKILRDEYIKNNLESIMLNISEFLEENAYDFVNENLASFYKEILEISRSDKIYMMSPTAIKRNKEIANIMVEKNILNFVSVHKKLLQDSEFMMNYVDEIIKNKNDLPDAYKEIEHFDREKKLKEKMSGIEKKEKRESRKKI